MRRIIYISVHAIFLLWLGVLLLFAWPFKDLSGWEYVGYFAGLFIPGFFFDKWKKNYQWRDSVEKIADILEVETDKADKNFLQALGSLNGWQRIWFVLSVIILVPTLVIGYVASPNKDYLYQAPHDVKSQIKAEKEWVDANKKACEITDLPAPNVDVEKQSEFLKKCERHQNDLAVYQDALDRQRFDRKEYNQELAKAIAYTTLGYLVSIGILYCLGLALGWIFAGFSKK